MDHDKLTRFIEDGIEYEYFNVPWIALRAVVELHKPFGSEEKGFICQFCMEKALPQWVYPCPTIQAIEKVLNGQR